MKIIIRRKRLLELQNFQLERVGFKPPVNILSWSTDSFERWVVQPVLEGNPLGWDGEVCFDPKRVAYFIESQAAASFAHYHAWRVV